jgi:hypothetical protein
MGVFPKGYALDATHRPHVTMLQRYVRTADLEKLYAVVGDFMTREKAAGWNLQAFKVSYVLWNGVGVTVIEVKPTSDLLEGQQRLIDAVP